MNIHLPAFRLFWGSPAGSMSLGDPHLPIRLPYTVIDLSCFQGSTKHETRWAGRISGGFDDLEVFMIWMCIQFVSGHIPTKSYKHAHASVHMDTICR